MTQIIHFFSLTIAAGLLGLTPFVNHARIQASFFKLISATSLLALALAYAFRPGGPSGSVGLPAPGPALLTAWFPVVFLVLAVVYALLVWSGRPAIAGRLAWVLLPSAAALLVLGGRWLAPAAAGVWTGVSVSLSLLTAAGLLGSVLLAMVLGHWYLMTPSLPTSHLHRLTTILAVFVAGRLLVFLAGAGDLLRGTGSLTVSDPLAWLVSDLPFLVLRCLLGIAIPAILAFRIDRFVRTRDTQKATGLLYVALIFVLFGELLATYLLVLTSVPT